MDSVEILVAIFPAVSASSQIGAAYKMVELTTPGTSNLGFYLGLLGLGIINAGDIQIFVVFPQV